MPAIDTPLFLWINAGEHTWVGWIELARFSSLVLPTALVLACALGCVVDPSTRRQAGRLLASMTLAWLGARMIQAAVPMARPFAIGVGTAWLTHARSAGFPSSHASVAMALACSAVLGRVPWPLRLSCVIGAVLIAWSRILLGLHFPSDVGVATAWGALAALLVQQAWPVLPDRSADLMQHPTAALPAHPAAHGTNNTGPD